MMMGFFGAICGVYRKSLGFIVAMVALTEASRSDSVGLICAVAVGAGMTAGIASVMSAVVVRGKNWVMIVSLYSTSGRDVLQAHAGRKGGGEFQHSVAGTSPRRNTNTADQAL